MIIELSDKILKIAEPLQLLDKYDVYEVLLSYWNETMNDDVSLIIQDERHYLAAQDIDVFMETVQKGKDKGKEKETGWEGKLIPKTIIIDVYFANEKSEIEKLDSKISTAQSEFDEFVEENSNEDEYLFDYYNREDDKEILEPKKIAARVKILVKNKKTDDEEYKILSKYCEDSENLKKLKSSLSTKQKELDKKSRNHYETLTEKEIHDLLLNKKWYKALQNGIDELYLSVGNILTSRITELAERYEETLPDIEKEVSTYEQKVASHLKDMGFEV